MGPIAHRVDRATADKVRETGLAPIRMLLYAAKEAEANMNWWKAEADGVRLTLHIIPRASQTALAGLHGDALKIRLQAPPVEGRANEALREFLAELFEVTRASVQVERGQTGRRKIVFIAGNPARLNPEKRIGDRLLSSV